MSYPINYPTPQGANVQIFETTSDWVKPQGASFVWFTLIGAGGGAGSITSTLYNGGGGGSGAVTNYMGPAFLMPDVLRISIGLGGISIAGTNGTAGGTTDVIYQTKDGTGYTLLTANGGGGGGTAGAAGAAGAASTSNFFSAAGFFQSVAGQAGNPGVTASPTTFLGGGAGGTTANSVPTANYGYTAAGNSAGFFLMQPIIVGVGGSASATGEDGGIGCGGGGNPYINVVAGSGGNGFAVVITW